MAISRKLQASFAAGEVSPALYSRPDLAAYGKGLKTCKNFQIMPTGGARNRPGTKFISSVKDPTKPVRLIEFVISTDEAYVIELGDEYARFYIDRARIEVTGVDAYAAGTTYAIGDLVADAGVNYYCIKAGVGHTPASSATYWYPLTGDIYEIPTPWAAEDLADLKFAQSNDVMYFVHPDYLPQTITFFGETTWVMANYLFVGGPFMPENSDGSKRVKIESFSSGAAVLDDLLLGVFNDYINGVKVAKADLIGSLFQLKQALPSASTSNTTKILCGSTWHFSTSGTWTGTVHIEVSIDEGSTWTRIRTFIADGAGNFEESGPTGYTQCWARLSGAAPVGGVYNLQGSAFEWTMVFKINSFTSSTGQKANCTLMTVPGYGYGIGYTSTPTVATWSYGSWSEMNGYPSSIIFFQDRLVTASTRAEPTTVWLTRIGNYDRYDTSFPIVDSDAISAPLPSRQVNKVRNLVSLTSLIALTSDSDFAIGPAAGSGPLTPTSISISTQGNRGTAGIDPAVVGNEILLMQQLGTIVRNYSFQLAVNGYVGDNISILSQHLFSEHQIVALEYAPEPDSIVFALRDDGVLLCLTYLREQEVLAWSRFETAGEVKSIVCLPSYTDGYTETWMVVERTVGGNTVQYIEVLEKRDQGTVPADQFFVDSGLSYEGAPSNTFSGLGHLEGKTVAVLGDGFVFRNLVVTSGIVTLPNGILVSKCHIGLPYECVIETLSADLMLQDGSSVGRKIRSPRITLWFWNSRGGYVGPGDAPGETDEIFQREPSDDYDTPLPLKTEQYQITIDGQYTYESTIIVKQIDPLPMTILSLMQRLMLGGD